MEPLEASGWQPRAILVDSLVWRKSGGQPYELEAEEAELLRLLSGWQPHQARRLPKNDYWSLPYQPMGLQESPGVQVPVACTSEEAI